MHLPELFFDDFKFCLSQMNDIVYQEVMADLCAAPPPTKPKQVEQEVDLEDLLDLIASDPTLVIDGADPCVVSDCFERRARRAAN